MLLEGGIALRGLFIIDKVGVLRHVTINDLPLGRSVDEAIRVIDALQHFEKFGEVCPADWKPGAMALAAAAGVLRWSVMAQTTDLVALALVQPLHGLTFALLHLACMRVIVQIVPAGLEGMRIAQISLRRRGAFCPKSLPLFQGSQCRRVLHSE